MEEHILAFDWKGLIAHFRQFDANSSSLSYSFPPPTVVCGMLAGIVGLEKDAYYQDFSPERVRVAVQVVSRPRKMVQTINYIYAKNPNELNMSSENRHTQIPVELVVAEQFPEKPLHYRVFVKIQERTLFEQIADALEHLHFRYLPYLGSAPFSSWIEWVGVPDVVQQVRQEEPMEVDTAVSLTSLKKKSFRMDAVDGVLPAYFREHMRRAFLPNREPGEVFDVVWERNRGKVVAEFQEPVYRLKFSGDTFNVVFL